MFKDQQKLFILILNTSTLKLVKNPSSKTNNKTKLCKLSMHQVSLSFSPLLLDDSVLTGLDKDLSLIQDGVAAAGAVGSTLISSALRRTLPEGPLAPDSTGETLL